MHAADPTTLAKPARSDELATSSSAAWWRQPFVLATLLALVTLTVYGRLYRAELLEIDDHENITTNEFINPPTWSGLMVFWAGPYRGMYAPLAYTLLAGESWIAQYLPGTEGRLLDPSVFHAGNVVLHAITVVLVFLILRWLIADEIAAALGALLFAIHPLQVEAVAWVTEVRGMLCGALAMLSIYSYLRFLGPPPSEIVSVNARDEACGARSGHARIYILAFAAYGLALLSKPSAASVPLMLMVIEFILYRRPLGPMLARLAWWVVPALVLAWWTRLLQDDNVTRFVYAPAWWQRPFVAMDAITFYLWKLLVPIGFAFDHGRNPQTVLAGGWIYVVWIVPIGIVLLCGMLPARRVWLTSLGIFVAGIFPSAGLVSFTFQDLSTVAERFAFLGMLGPALAFAWVTSRPAVRPWRGEMALVLVALALVTVRQTGFWHDTQTLLEHGLKVNPNSTLCLSNEAMQRANSGDLATAESLLQRVVAINPHEANVWTNLAVVYSRQKRRDDAIRALERAIEIRGNDPQPRLDLVKVLMDQGDDRDYERCIPLLEEVLLVRPQDVEAHLYLAATYVNRGIYAEAIEHWQAVVAAQPDDANARQMLGESLAQTGDFAGAIEQLQKVLELRPGDQRAKDYIRLIEAQPQPNRTTQP